MPDATPVAAIYGGDDALLAELRALAPWAAFRPAATIEGLRPALAGADVLCSFSFRAREVRAAWDAAGTVRWIHWCGAGVDSILFPDLVSSPVVLTNARGVFDQAMSEYVLGLILAFAKGLPETLRSQAERRWNYRLTERIAERHALIVGVGSIGRAIARMLKRAGMTVAGVGRTARRGDPEFGEVHAAADLVRLLPDADYVVAVLPLTAETAGMFGDREFPAMKATARFINVGRGASVDEGALARALAQGRIAGAALDVFENEPLPAESPLWSVPRLIVSPHMSGDFLECRQALIDLFVDNLRRYRAGEPLRNVVDKALGYVRS
jgi:phosphoglycerate dehydrogenase-like enzyme